MTKIDKNIRYFESMGHVASCYNKIFFHKGLNIFTLFYDNLILEI